MEKEDIWIKNNSHWIELSIFTGVVIGFLSGYLIGVNI